MSRSTADLAGDFVRRLAEGQKPSVRVQKSHANAFLGELMRLGVHFVDVILDEIPDPELRSIIKTVIFSGAGGVILGAAVGGMVGGAAGAKVGAVVGGVGGIAAAMFAYKVKLQQEAGPNGPELRVSVAA